MTVKDLRTLIDNLDEYIHVPGGIDRLKKTVLHLATSGKLVPQKQVEGTGDDLYELIKSEKQKNNSKQKPSSEIQENKIPFEIPESWRWVRLGNIIELKSGADLVPSMYSDLEVGVPYITGASSIQNEQVLLNRWTTDPKNIAEKGDLLITCKGTIGTMAFLNVERAHIARQIMAIKFNQFLNPRFIKLVITTNIDSLQEAAQSIIPGIARGDMLSMPVGLPSLAEQSRIVDKIDNIFMLIDDLAVKYEEEQAQREKFVAAALSSLSDGRSKIALSHLTDIISSPADAVQLRKTIHRLGISGLLVSQEASEGTGEDLYQKIQSEKSKKGVVNKLLKKNVNLSVGASETLFQIPKTWKWAKLSDFTTMQNGYAFKSSQWIEQGLPIVRIQNLNNHLASFNYVDENDVDDKYLIDDGQILLSWSGTPGTSFGVFIWNRGAAALNQHIFKCDVVGVDKEFFKMAANEAIYNKLSTAHGGVGLKHLTKTQIDMLPIQLPPLAEQERIVAKTFELLALVKRFEDTLKLPSVKSTEAKAQKQLPVAESAHADIIATTSSGELTNQQKKIQRKMLASFIANESLDGAQFGKTKFEKLLHLVEYHVLKKDLNQKYSVQPAGPYDGGFTRLYWDDVIKSKWFNVEGYGNLQKIVAGDKHEKSQKDYGYLSDDEKNKIKGLITLFKNWGYGEAEIISTLYAAWNNRLIKGEEVSDDLLKQDFLQWDPQKTQYSDRLDRALAWMCQNNIVPDGWGSEIKRAKSSTKASS